MKSSIFILSISFLLFSCSKSSDMTTKATPAAPTTQVPSQPTAPVITAPKSYAYAALYSSYQLKYESKSWVDMNTLRLKNNQNGFFAASYFDFDNDGDDDILVSPSGDAVELKRYNNDPSITKGDLELYTNQSGQYELSQTVFSPNGVGHIGPRKTILGDYDGDKMIDVLLLGTGYDPFPDEKEDPVLLINKGGKFNANSMTIMKGYRHGGCSGDIDKDGDIDVLLVGGNAQESNLFLNSGDGKFIANDNIFIDKGNIMFSVLNSELIDLDADGNLDMILLGSDVASINKNEVWAKNAGSKIFFGNPKLTSLELKNATIIPSPTYNLKGSEYRTIHDIDVIDLDGDKKNEIILLRVNDMHDGAYVQILKLNSDKSFTDISEKMIPNNCIRTNALFGGWLDYFKVGDIDNDGFLEIYSPFRRIDAPKTSQFTGYLWRMNANKIFQFIGSNY